MGTWSASLYGNDIAVDLKEVMRDLVRLPFDADRLAAMAEAAFAEAAAPDDDNHTDYCLALADLFHTYGLVDERVRERAMAVISNGADLAKKRELGMTEGDLRKRARVLAELAGRLAFPNANPRNRRVLRKPEAWLFEEGAVMTYATSQGQPVNPYMPKRLMTNWVADGCGSFVVLGRTRRYEFVAWYLIALVRHPVVLGVDPVPCVLTVVTLPKAHFGKMHMTCVGHLPLRETAIDEALRRDPTLLSFRPQHLANMLMVLTVDGSSVDLRSLAWHPLSDASSSEISRPNAST